MAQKSLTNIPILAPEDVLDNEEVLTQEYYSQEAENLPLLRHLSTGLKAKIKGNITGKRKNRETNSIPNTKTIPNTYYVLSHGQLALTKHAFKFDSIYLTEIKHITTPGSILLTHVKRDKDGIIFPLLHHLCNMNETVWHGITEDFILSSSKSTHDYDGVYLCMDGFAVRVIPFRNETVKVRLSTVVSKILQYNQNNFKEQPFNVKVLSCLKERNPMPGECKVADFKGLPHEECKFLDLSRECSIMIGGKSKRKRTRRKRSRKKLVQSYQSRR